MICVEISLNVLASQGISWPLAGEDPCGSDREAGYTVNRAQDLASGKLGLKSSVCNSTVLRAWKS